MLKLQTNENGRSYYTATGLLSGRDLVKLKRHHHLSLEDGAASLRWNPDPITIRGIDGIFDEEGHWEMFGPQGEAWIQAGGDLITVNQSWERFSAIANGQA